MASGCSKGNENIYFRCRKEAVIYDERLSSREGASELLGISVSSLADYELGNTKVVPVDKVELMADLYRSPQLRTIYCKTECPIGKHLPVATEIKSIETVAIRMLNAFDDKKVEEMKRQLLAVASDGNIDAYDLPVLQEIREYLTTLQTIISELHLICDKEVLKSERKKDP